MLRHSQSTIRWNIAHGHSVSARSFEVYDIITRGANQYKAQFGKLRKDFFRHPLFVEDNHLSIFGALYNLVGGGAVIHRKLPKFCQASPLEVARVEHKTIQKNDIHCFFIYELSQT